MKLLFDQDLSRRLVRVLADVFPGSTHVALQDLDTATDRQVWDFAGANDYVVGAKDSDFRCWLRTLMVRGWRRDGSNG